MYSGNLDIKIIAENCSYPIEIFENFIDSIEKYFSITYVEFPFDFFTGKRKKINRTNFTNFIGKHDFIALFFSDNSSSLVYFNSYKSNISLCIHSRNGLISNSLMELVHIFRKKFAPSIIIYGYEIEFNENDNNLQVLLDITDSSLYPIIIFNVNNRQILDLNNGVSLIEEFNNFLLDFELTFE